MNRQLVNAIRNRRMIEFDYGDHRRIAEPHVYGLKDGTEQLLVYQVAGGSSSGGLPEWRRVDLPRMSGLSILEDTFVGPRPNPSGRHSIWDQIYEKVT